MRMYCLSPSFMARFKKLSSQKSCWASNCLLPLKTFTVLYLDTVLSPIMQNSFAVYVGKRISGVWFVDRMWTGKVKITHCSIFHGCLVPTDRTALDAFHRQLFVFLGAEVTLPLFTLNFPEIGQPMQVAPPAPGTDWWSLDMFGLCWCLLPLC